MADLSQAIVLFVALLALLASGVWVALVLIACGILSIFWYADAPAGIIFATKAWDSSASWALTALPLFIWMGEILYRTRLAEDMFSGLGPWVQRLPGRRVQVNTLGCGIFAAVSGSSAATAATIGRISLPELKARGYDDSISIGSLAGAGTLGLLIPPSIVMIVYAVAAQVSIIRLFVAGVLPGILLMCLFSAYIAIWSIRHPDRVPAATEQLSLGEKVRRLRLLLPVVLLMRLYPTGSMVRSSSQSKSIPLELVADTSDTGMCTRPKLIAPFQIARAMTVAPRIPGCLRMTRPPVQKFSLRTRSIAAEKQ